MARKILNVLKKDNESKTFLEDNYNNNNNSNNNTQSKLHIIEFCIFNNETAVHFENELANIKN